MDDVSARLAVQLLGPFMLGNGVRLPTRKAEGLLAYLALSTGRPHRRDALAGLLWGDRAERQARHSLSQTLFAVRKALADDGRSAPLLVVDGDLVMLAAEQAEVDVTHFERLCREGTAEACAAAANLYRGEFMQGFNLREFGFEDWLVGERARIKELAQQVFANLLNHQRQAGELDRAVQVAMRLVALDPLQEKAHRSLMELYAGQGRLAAALRQYDICASLLQRDLGVEPETETRMLRAEIARRRSARRVAGEPQPLPMAASEPAVVDTRPRDAAPTGRSSAVAAVPIGREQEIRRLLGWFGEVCEGRRKMVFVVGESGMGKTTLVDAFIAALSVAHPTVAIGRGQCIDHRGAGEPYLPFLDALTAICRSGGEALSAIAAYAPSWIAQMPALAAHAEGRPAAIGTTQERMLREMVEALEAAAVGEPLLIVLEDLHWSDCSTLDLLEALAHRREPARWMVVVTCRRADAAAEAHPLQSLARTLRIRGLCEELSLPVLGEKAVAAYLAARFPAAVLPAGLAATLASRAGGNPLFMSNLVDWWLAKGMLLEAGGELHVPAGLAVLEQGVPEDLGFLIAQQLARLSGDERRALEAASVAGHAFAAATVASALGDTEDAVESTLAALARRSLFVRACGSVEWPDGTLSGCFEFLHQLYREAVYQDLAMAARVLLHRRIGERLEAGHAGGSAPVADLAMHFRQGRDARRAVRYLAEAAEQAFRLSGYRDVVSFLTEALSLITGLDESERAAWELQLQAMFGPALVFTRGWGAPEAEQAYRRACELCRIVGDDRRLSSVMFGLATLLEFRGEFAKTQAILSQRFTLLERAPDPSAVVESEELMACSKFHHGSFAAAIEHAEHGLAAYDAGRDLALNACMGDNPAVSCHNWAGRALWFLGNPAEALARCRRGLELALGDGYSFALALAHEHMARLHQHGGEPEAALDHAIRAVALADEYGFAYRAAAGAVLRGWARAALGEAEAGLADIERGLAGCRAIGAALDYPYLLALKAEAQHFARRPEDGLETLEGALALSRRSNGFFYHAEILRLIGVLERQRTPRDGGAERALQAAVEVSRRQGARGLELRCAESLARLMIDQGRKREAADLVTSMGGAGAAGAGGRDRAAWQTLVSEIAPHGPR